jgi:plastocyanin
MRLRALLIPTAAAITVLVVALVVRNQPTTIRVAPSSTKASTALRSGHVAVAISNYAFVPKALTVKVGTRVSWTNRDSTAHTATADKGGFDTGTVAPHATRTIDFKHPGTFTYHCAFHAFMTATITVKP